jgi:hypothetical protein
VHLSLVLATQRVREAGVGLTDHLGEGWRPETEDRFAEYVLGYGTSPRWFGAELAYPALSRVAVAWL